VSIVSVYSHARGPLVRHKVMENQQQSEICVVEELIRGLSPTFRTPSDSWGAECGIEEVSIDLSGNYKSLVRKNCPSAEVTVDRFHVTKMSHEELNQARIDKKTAEALKVKERAKLFTS